MFVCVCVCVCDCVCINYCNTAFLGPEGGSPNAEVQHYAQRIISFLNDIRHINSCFTYLLYFTYLLALFVVVVVVVVVISSLNIPKAFLIRSPAQQNFAHTFVLIFPTDLPFRILNL